MNIVAKLSWNTSEAKTVKTGKPLSTHGTVTLRKAKDGYVIKDADSALFFPLDHIDELVFSSARSIFGPDQLSDVAACLADAV